MARLQMKAEQLRCKQLEHALRLEESQVGRMRRRSRLSSTPAAVCHARTHARSTAWLVPSCVLFVQRLEAASKAIAVDMQLKAEFGVQLQLHNEIEVERSQHHATVTSLRDELQRVRTFTVHLGSRSLSTFAAAMDDRARQHETGIMSDRTGKVSVGGSRGAGSAV